MRILDVREVTKPISSPIRNAYIDFTKMTTSLVAVVTDVVRDGRRVVGYGFNSNGRYGQGGLIRERFAPRLTEADPAALLDDSGTNIDPDRAWAAMMANEKPGGHGERSVAVGTLDMAIWDADGQDRRSNPLFRLLAEQPGPGGRTLESSSMRRVATITPARTTRALRVRDARLPRARLHRRQDEDRRRSDCRGSHRRIEAVLAEIDGEARNSRWTPTGGSISTTGITYAKMLRDYPLFWYEEVGDPLDYRIAGGAWPSSTPVSMATGENLFSHQDARNLLRYGGMRPDRDWLQFDCALSYGLCRVPRRTLDGAPSDSAGHPSRCIPHGGHQMSLNIAAGPRDLAATRATPTCSSPTAAFRTASPSRAATS